MKNAINYYYNISPKSIHQKGKDYYFSAEEGNYVLTIFDNVENINEIYELANSLINNKIYVHQLIINNNKSLITNINDQNYLLLRIYIEKKEINLKDVFMFNSLYINDKLKKITNIPWYDLWSNKIDYLEYQMNQIGKKHPLLVESFSYYVGLAENAIQLANMSGKEDIYYTLNHRRITCSDDSYNLYNPLNLVIDVRIRDICDYFKSCFFTNKNVHEITSFLLNNNLSKNEKTLFIARMLFPTYYFDIYEKIISGQIEENEIKNIINKTNEYEQLLKNIYYAFKNDIPEIEWLKKVIQY